MAFGISALTCQLDADLPVAAGGVDWGDLVAWPQNVRPTFAGKYVIGSPWRWEGVWDLGEVHPPSRSVPHATTPCEEEAARIARELAAGQPSRRLAFSPPRQIGPVGLPTRLLQFFERALGHDFSGVRVHAEASIPGALGVAGCTLGADVWLATGHVSLELLSHELVHVVQQGAAPRTGPAMREVRLATPPVMQAASIDPNRLYDGICPPGTVRTSYPSNGPIGTAIGKWLGLMYVQERRQQQPALQSYILVDFDLHAGWGTWTPQTIFDLWKYDPNVVLALGVTDWARRGLQRADILDSDLDDLYEIKPRRSASAGPPQLERYRQQLTVAAEFTNPNVQMVRRRAWSGGGWDPSRYPLVLPASPGRSNEICFIRATQDPANRGVIIYDIICCAREPDDTRAEDILVVPVLRGLVRQLDAMRPQLEHTLHLTLPRAPVGSTYAFVVPPRFFEVFVLGPWRREQDRLLQQQFPRASPQLIALVLASWTVAFVLSSELSLAALIYTDFMPADEFLRIYGIRVAVSVCAVAGLVALEGALAAMTASVVTSATVGGAAATTAAAQPLVATTALTAATGAEVALGPLVATGAAGEAISAGASVAPWVIGSGASAGAGGAGAGTGMTLVGVAVVGLLSTDANAATGSNPGVPQRPVASDPVYLVPTQMLIPRSGTIELGAEVRYGDDTFHIIGLVTSDAPPP